MAVSYRSRPTTQQPLAGHGAPMVRPQRKSVAHVKEEDSPATKAKTKVIFVEQKKKALDIRYDAASVPKDYQLVEYGNKQVIDFLLERSRKSGLPVWIANSALQAQKGASATSDHTKLSYHVGRIGYHFHKDLVDKARKLYNVTLQKGKLKSLGHGSNQKVTRADHERGLAELYPHMPDRDRQTVIRSLSTKGTKIGKATGTMNMYKQIELAVIAHVRHSHTDYEKLIYMSGKIAARNAVESQITAKLAEWKGEDGQHVDENETELVEFEEDDTSDSAASPIMIEDEDDDDDDDYEPPPVEQLMGHQHQPQSVARPEPARSWSRYQGSEDYSPPQIRPPPVHFGNNQINDYSFDYRQPPPHFLPPPAREYSPPPQHYPSRGPPSELPHFPPPMPYAGGPRVHLRPLPPSPPPQHYPPAPPGYEHDFRAPPRDAQCHEYQPTTRRPRYSPPPAVPAIRYRPLSPEDVVPSREQYEPIAPPRKRVRPNEWEHTERYERYY